MKIKIDAFGGIKPRVSSRLLQNEEATVALNCRLYNGKLRGFRVPELITEGTIETSMAITQAGIEVVSYGVYMQLMQAGVEVVSNANPALQLAQVGVEVVSEV